MGKLAFSTAGSARAEHAANILAAATMWGNYATLHNQALADAGRQPYVAVNAEGARLAAANDPADAALQRVLQTNASSLRHEDFLTIQDRIVETRRRALNGITDLQSAGLSFPASITDQLVGFENLAEFDDARQDMNPTNTGNNETAFTLAYTPLPITHQGFTVPWRQDGFNYNQSLGVTESTRQVAERLEMTLFNGNGDIVVNYNGTAFPLYGYTTHPNRGTGTVSNWTDPANAEKIVDELIVELGKMWAEQGGVRQNSVMVYVPNSVWTIFSKDYKAGVRGTIIDRVREVPHVMDVKPGEMLADANVALVEMDERTVQLAVASDIMAVPHTKDNPFAPTTLTTYAAMVQQIKVDSAGNTGVRHLTW